MSKFRDLIRAGLEERGAVATPTSAYDYKLETPAGLVRFQIRNEGMVGATFDEPDVAQRHYECFWPTESPPSPNSGAWNHHYERYMRRGGKTQVAVDRFFSLLDRLLHPPTLA